MQPRRSLLEDWLKKVLDAEDVTLERASRDASFRRYWRLAHGGHSYIVMDAPPEREGTRPFVRIAQALRSVGLHTPEIFFEEPDLGFLLLEDFGTRLYLDVLDGDNVDRLYGDALGALAVVQACGPTDGLPVYDGPFLRREMDLFQEWLVDRLLDIQLTPEETASLEGAWELLVDSALEQPHVCVHRDFHSRNLMLTEPPSPGILDFQDAVVGPVTYDPVSLLRDCYISWPRERVEEWARGYFALAVQSGILRPEHDGHFLRWFDLMGVQRHLKASGIFARLNIRDGKPGYLGDIPRTLGYVMDVAPSYPQLCGLADLIGSRILPALGTR